MQVTFNEKIIAYLALISGLSISAVAVYYSVVGLTTIFAAAVLPIIIMGTVLEISKLVATVWLKQNWKITPWAVRGYLLAAILVLMLITSMGIFGLLSKAHSDQSLVSGDVLAKIALYDEKIQIEKENIDAARNALAQMDSQVNERLSRSTDDRGAERAVQIRRQQQAERNKLQRDIINSQSNIAKLSNERAPIAAEVRKVEAEVGPLKYIASFVYGETDQTILEKAVTWVIILIVVVFDPLAIILLLASQISFQNFRERINEYTTEVNLSKDNNDFITTVEKKDTIVEEKISDVLNGESVAHSYLNQGFSYPDDTLVQKSSEIKSHEDKEWEEWVEKGEIPVVENNPTDDDLLADKLKEDVKNYGYSAEGNIVKVAGKNYDKSEFDRLMAAGYVQNEEQKISNLWSSSSTVISQEEYMKTATAKKEAEEAEELARRIRNGEMTIEDVLAALRDDVKSRL